MCSSETHSCMHALFLCSVAHSPAPLIEPAWEVGMQGTDGLPRVVVTSYDMLHRLTCEPCKRSDMKSCTGRQVMPCYALVFNEPDHCAQLRCTGHCLHTSAALLFCQLS